MSSSLSQWQVGMAIGWTDLETTALSIELSQYGLLFNWNGMLWRKLDVFE